MATFGLPFKGKYALSSGYPFRNNGITPHSGLDYACPTNTEIIPSSVGVVIRSDGTDKNGFGNQVRIWHESLGVTTVYAHLNKILVKTGQEVSIKDVIGLSGGNPNDDIPGDGSSKGAHIHWEVQVGKISFGGKGKNKNIKTLDPRDLMKKYPVKGQGN